MVRPCTLLLPIAAASSIALAADPPEPLVYQDWAASVGNDKTYVFAATANDSGEVLGEYCYFSDGKCIWLIGITTGCKPGDTYPVLANSDANTVSLEVVCRGQLSPGVFTLQFTNWKNLEANFTDSSRVGFAIPLKDNTFRVVRFSLKGRSTATTVAEEYFSSSLKKTKSESTKDQVL